MAYDSAIVPKVHSLTVGTSAVSLKATSVGAGVPQLAYAFNVTADATNSGTVYIGDANVSASNYYISISAGGTINFDQVNGDAMAQQYNITEFYAVASAGGQEIYVGRLIKARGLS